MDGVNGNGQSSFIHHPCTVCCRTTTMWCSRRQSAWNCSREHLSNDGPHHRECVAVPVQSSSQVVIQNPPAAPKVMTVTALLSVQSQHRVRTINMSCQLMHKQHSSPYPMPLVGEPSEESPPQSPLLAQGFSEEMSEEKSTSRLDLVYTVSLATSVTPAERTVLSTTQEITVPSFDMVLLEEVDDVDEPHLSDNEEPSPKRKGPLQELLQRRPDLNLTGQVRLLRAQGGQGGYSDIFTGYRMPPDGNEYKVAVKKLRAHIVKEGRKFEKRLAKELHIWSKLNHPRILPLEGFYVSQNHYPYLISKWMDNGTIMDYLARNPDANMLSLVTGIAEGTQYLHSQEIIHSDIKPENVLISDLGEPLLCDFGVSRLLEVSKTLQISTIATGGQGGTIRYMSKEMLQGEPGGYSKQSDVWAFGMTIYTLLTRDAPYHDIKLDAGVIVAIINDKLPAWPKDSDAWSIRSQSLRRLCESCWKEKLMRPSIDDLVSELRSLTRAPEHSSTNINDSVHEIRDPELEGKRDMNSEQTPVAEVDADSDVKHATTETAMQRIPLKQSEGAKVNIDFKNTGDKIISVSYARGDDLPEQPFFIRPNQILRRQFAMLVPYKFTLVSGRFTKNEVITFDRATTIDANDRVSTEWE